MPPTHTPTDAPVRVLVWNEFRHERTRDDVRAVYPDGIHATLAAGLASDDLEIATATLDEPEHGLTAAAVDRADVIVWWGHAAHQEVADEAVERVRAAVLAGTGLVALHSAHESKIFTRLLGTTGSLKWREAGEAEIVWNLEPSHPLAAGVGDRIELPHEEMYGERFDVPPPDEVVFLSWFEGGEVFRSGCTWRRGHGKVVYFRPGHETYPTYHRPEIIRVIANAVRWAARDVARPAASVMAEPVRPLDGRRESAGA
ncbi:MAG: ThuA domain-containing protein [Planctomycetota bacterium]